jgi:hypothetical protein
MVTYRKIQEYVMANFGFVPKTCWIAHVLSDYGMTHGAAPNRIDANRRKVPCPSEKRGPIEMACWALGRIPA